MEQPKFTTESPLILKKTPGFVVNFKIFTFPATSALNWRLK